MSYKTLFLKKFWKRNMTAITQI